MNLEQMIQRQQELLNTARTANRELTAEEKAEFDALQRSIDAFRMPASTAVPTVDVEAVRTAERQRVSEITSLCREFKVSGEIETKYITDGTSIDAVRAAILDLLRKNETPIAQRASVDVTNSAEDKFRSAASDSLMMRAGVSVDKPSEGSKELRGISLRDLAIECLSREGDNELNLRRMSNEDLLQTLSRQYFNPTAAFPAILDSAIEKSIVKMYDEVPTTFQEWTQKGSLKDFKETADHQYVIGGTGDFLKVPENGELKHDTPQTSLLPSRKLDTYGRQFSMTRQAFINDDIGFITEIPGLYATAAKKTIDKQCYNLLYNNSTIFDNKALFHADHKNLISGTGAAPSQATIQAIILQSQKQTDQFGDAITMIPSKIICGVGYEFDLAVIFGSAQVTGSANNDKNPLYNYPLKVVQTPVLNALAGAGKCPWFLTVSPSSAKGIQVDYLNGQERPTIRRMEVPGVLGFVWDIYLDWGIAVRDFRGLYKNVGAIIA